MTHSYVCRTYGWVTHPPHTLTHTHTRTNTNTRPHMCTHAHTHTHTHTHTHALMTAFSSSICTHTHTHTQHTHTHTHTHRHTHKHVCRTYGWVMSCSTGPVGSSSKRESVGQITRTHQKTRNSMSLCVLPRPGTEKEKKGGKNTTWGNSMRGDHKIAGIARVVR